MIEVRVQGVTSDASRDVQIVWLVGLDDQVMLPVLVSATEASLIQASLDHQPSGDPQIHDLLIGLLGHFEAQVQEVRLLDLDEQVLRGEVVVLSESRAHSLVASPCEAMALAIRAKAPIFLSESVLDRAGFTSSTVRAKVKLARGSRDAAEADRAVSEAVEELVEEMWGQMGTTQAVDQVRDLEAQLRRAVAEERYEDAAELKQAIERQQEQG